MKPLFRVLALVTVLGIACLPASSAPTERCRYLCGSTLHEASVSQCCSHTFTCPNGQQVPAYKVYSTAAGGWIVCP